MTCQSETRSTRSLDAFGALLDAGHDSRSALCTESVKHRRKLDIRSHVHHLPACARER